MVATELSNTWIIIKIGTREYAVNSAFVKAVTELKHESFLQESSNSFIRGYYNIFNSKIAVVDGFKMASVTTLTESKLEFSKNINDIKLKYMTFLDLADWVAAYTEKDDKLYQLACELTAWANSETSYQDPYMVKLMTRIKEQSEINIGRIVTTSKNRMDDTITYVEAMKSLEMLRREADRHILDALDNVIDCYASKMSELCVVVSASGKNFGISIEMVELVTDECDNLSSNKKTNLSAGQVKIGNKKYNVLDLTKVGRIIV